MTTTTFSDIADWVNHHYADGTAPDRTELVRRIEDAAGADPGVTASVAYVVTHYRAERGQFLRTTVERVSDRILERLSHPGPTPPYNHLRVQTVVRGIASDMAEGWVPA
ncbi:hypothetical protein ABTY20_23070 [Streptomyces sp. NPDC126497]|uniref:hypothetical protein n=1 Tax=Streptomyces sp. NPDC126497 TaxID=3155313 RepID=UPI0033326FBD